VEGLEEWLDLELVEPLEPEAAPRVLQRLQQELPDGLRLQSCAVVPLQGPSLSQELEGARWHFSLQCESGTPEAPGRPWPEAEEWEGALQALMQSDRWIWNDRDKKGRPRQRDCRPALRQLSLAPQAGSGSAVNLVLETRIDTQGFGVRPEHLRSWLSDHLALPLRLGPQKRAALILRSQAAC
jgi:radical SAM-linked protein